MGNEDVCDLTAANFVSKQLHLGAFSAVDQIIIAIVCNDLTGRMSIEGRDGGIVSENGKCQHVQSVSSSPPSNSRSISSICTMSHASLSVGVTFIKSNRSANSNVFSTPGCKQQITKEPPDS